MPLILKSAGFTLFDHYVPPFELRSGTWIDLWLPIDTTVENDYVGSSINNHLVKILRGSVSHFAVEVEEPLEYVESFAGDPPSVEQLCPTTPQSYLLEHSRLNYDERQQVMAQLNITRQLPLNRFGGTTRKLLALRASLSKSKNVLFGTPALDTAGLIAVYQVLETEVLRGGSVIELNLSDYRERRDHNSMVRTIIIERR